jgi:hypothetical protein
MRFTVPLAVASAVLLSACSGSDASTMGDEHVVLRNLVDTELAAPAPEHHRIQGTLIPTASDPVHDYYLLRQRRTLNGTNIAILRQERAGRVAFARTEVDCANRLFHVIGVANTRGRVESNVAHDGPLRPIEGLPLREELASYVCQTAQTPLAAA